MTHPNIRFRISAKKDFETLLVFTEGAKYSRGRDLDWAVFNKYPNLKPWFDKNFKIKDQEMMRRFIYSIYRNKREMMGTALMNHKKRWEKIVPRYFSLVDALFDSHRWPRGKYIAFGTIWGMYPRFLEDKTFQVPYWHRTPKYVPVVIAHELLHFMFYDYFYEHYPKYRQSKDNYFVWHVSEIFNTIVQNSPLWLRCFKIKSRGYPEHKKIVKLISHMWYRRDVWDIDILVDDIMREIKRQKLAP